MDTYAKMDNSQMGKNAFELFATEGQNFIDYKNLEAVAKEVGAELSDQEIKAMIDTYDSGTNGSINKGTFLKIMQTPVTVADMEREYKRFLQKMEEADETISSPD